MNRSQKSRPKITRDVVVRTASRKDTAALVHLAAELNEKAITKSVMARDVFGRKPAVRLAVAVLDGAVVAAAFYVHTYEAATATRGFFVSKFLFGAVARARSVGPVMAAALAALAKKKGATFLQWASEAWNVEDHDDFRRMGATDIPLMSHGIEGAKFTTLAENGAAFLKTR